MFVRCWAVGHHFRHSTVVELFVRNERGGGGGNGLPNNLNNFLLIKFRYGRDDFQIEKERKISSLTHKTGFHAQEISIIIYLWHQQQQ
jgi:hypothetical protein